MLGPNVLHLWVLLLWGPCALQAAALLGLLALGRRFCCVFGLGIGLPYSPTSWLQPKACLLTAPSLPPSLPWSRLSLLSSPGQLQSSWQTSGDSTFKIWILNDPGYAPGSAQIPGLSPVLDDTLSQCLIVSLIATCQGVSLVIQRHVNPIAMHGMVRAQGVGWSEHGVRGGQNTGWEGGVARARGVGR